MTEPRLREATEADDTGMRAVIAAAFPDNPKRDAEMTAWQYWTNPFGRTCAWVWEDDDRIVGTYAAFALPAVIDGRAALVANGVDAAVDPGYQGRGLFEPLARSLYAGAGRMGMALTLCFINNPVAVRGTTKAGWLPVGRLAVWVLPVDDEWLGDRTHLPPVLAGAGRRLLWRIGHGPSAAPSGIPAGLDDLWERAGAVGTGVRRGQAWWEWRYGARPGMPYAFIEARGGGRLRGAAAMTAREAFGGRFVYLLEFLAEDEAAGRALVSAAAAHARAIGAVGVATIGLPGTRLATLVAHAGLRRVPRRLDPKPTSFGAVANDGRCVHLQAMRWSVSWGDLDHL